MEAYRRSSRRGKTKYRKKAEGRGWTGRGRKHGSIKQRRRAPAKYSRRQPLKAFLFFLLLQFFFPPTTYLALLAITFINHNGNSAAYASLWLFSDGPAADPALATQVSIVSLFALFSRLSTICRLILAGIPTHAFYIA